MVHASKTTPSSVTAGSAALVSREGSIDWLCWPGIAFFACVFSRRCFGTAENGY